MSKADPAEAIRGALGLTKLSPDLENILKSPLIDRAISYAAKKAKPDVNPFSEYFSEQFWHVAWHVDDWAWGSSKPFLWRRTGPHPELKYETPKKFLKKSQEHLLSVGINIPYHIRSLFGGTDESQGIVHWSDMGNLQKVKTFFAILKESPGYLKKVYNKVLFDAKKLKATDLARTYLREMGRTKIVTHALKETRKEAIPFVNSFDGIIVNGLEDKIDDGKSAADLLREGGVLIHQNHPSLVQLPLNFFVFERAGVDNVITISGNNLIKRMERKEYARKLDLMLTNSGALFFERDTGSSESKKTLGKVNEDSYLRFVLLEEFIAQKLRDSFNIHWYSNEGREKLTNEPNSKIALIRAARKAKYLLVSAFSFDIIVDDRELATTDSKTPHASFEDLDRMKGSGNGTVFVNFGKPISMDKYFVGVNHTDADEKMLGIVKKRIDADITDSLKRLITFTPTYVLSAAVKQSKLREFSLYDVLGNAHRIVRYARENGFPLPHGFKTDYGFLPEIQKAFGMLVERGAMVKIDSEKFAVGKHQEPMLDFYAAKLGPTLALAKK
jgi:hypothetical protein